MQLRTALILIPLLTAVPAHARDSLGLFETWAAFRDPAVPRCYAISRAEKSPATYADIGTWPKRAIRGQFHIRLSRGLAQNAAITLTIGDQHFALSGSGTNAWATDKRMDAAINAALRSAFDMRVLARDASGKSISENWKLAGAASAMDAAMVGCAGVG
jgi:hypothetical protein